MAQLRQPRGIIRDSYKEFLWGVLPNPLPNVSLVGMICPGSCWRTACRERKVLEWLFSTLELRRARLSINRHHAAHTLSNLLLASILTCTAAGVAVRSGHLCTQPLHAALGISASVRASLYIYNTPAEIEVFISELKDAIKFFT